MSRDQKRPTPRLNGREATHPIISDTMHIDTLDRVTDIIELLGQLDMSDGMTPGARAGLQWIHWMLVDAVKHVSEGLRCEKSAVCRKMVLRRD